MTRVFISILLISLILLSSSAVAAGSVTITSQVLDSSVRPGGETTIFLNLANPSTTTTVRGIRLHMIPGPYITPSISYIELGSLDVLSSQQTTLTVKIDQNAVSMTSYITIRATYYTDSVEQETRVNIPITIRRSPILQIGEVNYTPSFIEPGNSVIVNIDLKNDGNGNARDVRAVMIQTTNTFVVEGSPEVFIDQIKSKSIQPISFVLKINPSATIGVYSIPISLTYLDETGTQNYSDTKYIGLIISGKYNFVIVSESQDIVAPGKKGTVSLQIANAGNQKALYLTAKILPSDTITQITPSKVYIGNLDSDDYDIQKFEFKVNEDASPGVYPLNIQLTYKDLYGKEYDENYNVQIKVSTQQEYSDANKKNMTPYYAIIVMVLIFVGYFGYKHFKRKK